MAAAHTRSVPHRWQPGLVALGLAAGLLPACEPPPENSPRFWQETVVEAPADAGAPPLTGGDTGGSGPILAGSGGGGGFPGDQGGAGGAVGGGAGGSAGSGGSGGAGDAGSADVPPPDAGATLPGGGATKCTMMVTLTTVTTNLDYAPRNIGAVWIADAGGKYLKSLEVWANRRMSHLDHWVTVTGAAGRDRDTVDAITSATLSRHTSHSSSWDCTSAAGVTMAQGTYQLCMEMNESNDAPVAYQCVKFDHAGKAWKLMPPDTQYFKGRSLVYGPR
jgi:hypothetical protein